MPEGNGLTIVWQSISIALICALFCSHW